MIKGKKNNEVMAEIFPDLVKNTNLQIQVVH